MTAPSQSEIDAAAERLRLGLLPLLDLHRWHSQHADLSMLLALRELDRLLHDTTPASLNWWISCGAKQVAGWNGWWIDDVRIIESHWYLGQQPLWTDAVPTCGQVMYLCVALGIKLKEPE